MGKPVGWRNESQRHSLAARGHRSRPWSWERVRDIGAEFRGTIRGLPRSASKLEKEDPEAYIDSVDLAYNTLVENNWSFDRMALDLDRDYMVLKQEYKETGNPAIKREMDINEAAQSKCWDFGGRKFLKNWPEIRDEVLREYGL